jgi:hypothetical protein
MKNGLYSVHILMGDGVHSEVFGTSLVGSRSISFRATLRFLADI